MGKFMLRLVAVLAALLGAAAALYYWRRKAADRYITLYDNGREEEDERELAQLLETGRD